MQPSTYIETYLSQRLLHFRTGQESSLQFTPPCGLCVPATRWTGYRTRTCVAATQN